MFMYDGMMMMSSSYEGTWYDQASVQVHKRPSSWEVLLEKARTADSTQHSS